MSTRRYERRNSLNLIEEGLRVCDYLVYYTRNGDVREIVCFLELKGSKLEDAIKQVLNTYKHFLTLWEKKGGKTQNMIVGWKVCICLHGQAPRNGLRIVNDLIDKFGKSNICIKHVSKQFTFLGDFLRSNL